MYCIEESACGMLGLFGARGIVPRYAPGCAGEAPAQMLQQISQVTWQVYFKSSLQRPR